MKVETLLQEAGVKFEEHDHPAAYTAQELAAEEHVSGHSVAKAIVVRADGRHVICVLPASQKLDVASLAKSLGAKTCRLADEQEMARLFPDVEVGAEPPFGKPYGLETFVDRCLATRDMIVFNAGTHRKAIRMRYDDYARLAEAQVLDLCVHM